MLLNAHYSNRLALKSKNILKLAQESKRHIQAQVTPNVGQAQTMNSIAVSTMPETNLTLATVGVPMPAIALAWRLPAGSRFEDANSMGHSHFYKHLLFMVFK